MRTRTKILIGVGVVAAAAIAIPTVALATADDADVPITGAALGKASQVAVDHLGGGKVTGTEVGDEESYYEVEVTLEDGTQVDVQLDEGFNVVATEADAQDDEGPGDD